MTRHRHADLRALALLSAALLAAAPLASQQEDDTAPVNRTVPQMPTDPAAADRASDDAPDVGPAIVDPGAGHLPSALVRVPMTGVFPAGNRPAIDIESPVAGDPQAAVRGMGYFNQFNCVGCHAPNGAGGMGPSLSNSHFVYGGAAGNIYLSIMQGRPAGMPAYGAILPDPVVWDIVAYVRAISEDESEGWGQTISLDHYTIEQVPSEYQSGVDPWQHTQPFSFGQPPFERVETPEKPE